MRNKIIITLFIIILLIQSILPIRINAFTEKREIVSASAKINNYQTEQTAVEENEMTGLNLIEGILIEPTFEFLTFIVDSIMSVFSGVMTQEEIQFVMVDQEEKDSLPDLGEEGTKYPIEDMGPYKSASGNLNKLKYPRFTYSPEEIFAGKIDFLNIDFISGKVPQKDANGNILKDENGNIVYIDNPDEQWGNIRAVVAEWYKILRMVAIIGLLSVLIYTGIKIIISSNTKEKAKYKEMIANWFIAVVLAFSMHYIMAFILAVIEQFVGLLSGLTGVIRVTNEADGINFTTNLIGLARFQMQQQHFSVSIWYFVIYVALVTFTFKFTFLYLKRVLKVAFLTVISPIVAITYPMDKMEGEAKGFKMWLREYIYNALLQPMHYILYYILVTSSLSLAAHNPVYALAALMFMAQAEKILKKIFGFDKARAGTVGGIAGAFATGAITTALVNYAKDPMHPFGGGKRNSKSGGTNSSDGSSSDGSYSPEEWVDFKDDTTETNDLLEMLGIDTNLPNRATQRIPQEGEDGQQIEKSDTPDNSIISELEKFFSRYRQTIPVSINDSGEFYLDEDASYSMEDVLKMLADYKKPGPNSTYIPGFEKLSYDELRNLLLSKVDANESQFINNGILPQYIDGDRRTSRELMDDIIRLNNGDSSLLKPGENFGQSEEWLKILKSRMNQNRYIEKNGGAISLRQQEKARLESLRNTSQNQENASVSRFEVPSRDEQKPEIIVSTVQEEKIDKKPELTIAETKEQNDDIKPKLPTYTTKKQEKEQRKLKRQQSWKQFKQKPVIKGVARAGEKVGKTIAKPVWDFEKGTDWKYNGERLAKNILKGAVGVTAGVAAATVQAGISITDGKYSPAEGVATVAAGIAGVSKLAKTSEQLREERSKDQQTLEKYSEQWFNRDDIISSYNRQYPGEGKAMRRRAVNNYVSRGITDFKDQKQGMKYADVLMKERGLNQEEADKLAIATLQYKRNLTKTNSYMVLFDEKRREKYINTRVDAYSGAASRDSIRRLHDDLIENVREFDKVNS